MPLPDVKKNEQENQYMQRCMTFLGEENRPNEQKVAMCLSTYRNSKKETSKSTVMEAVDFSFSCGKYLEEWELGWTEELDEFNFIVPDADQYYSKSNDCEDEEDEEENDDDEDEEDISAASLWENIRKKRERLGKKYKPAKPGDKDRPDPEAWKKAQQSEAGYRYKNLKTGEVYTYDKRGSYKKDGVNLFYLGKTGAEIAEEFAAVAAEYQGRKVTLNKPFRTPSAAKKFAVYVRNKQGNVIIVRFGDQNMTIKKNDPERRRSFKARHNCDTAKDRTTPRYWSCNWSW